MSKHRFGERCEHFSGPPDVACTYEGAVIVERIITTHGWEITVADGDGSATDSSNADGSESPQCHRE